jgi:diguanylate cyclase (GGDEF)-like protein
MQPHVPTMLVSTIVSALLVSVILPFAQRSRRAPGIREATLSAICFAASCILILLKDVLVDEARIVPANGLMWMGFALQWLAYARFDAPSAAARLPIGGTAVAIAAFTAFWGAGADYRERSIYASAVVATLAVASGWQLLRGGGLRRERSRAIGLFLAAVTVACQAVRLPMLLELPSGDGALLSGSLEQSVAFLPAMMHVLGVGLGFLVMHVERNELLAHEAALTDPLTGCANRRAFATRVAEELAHAARSGEPLSVVLTDIDRFKAVNDAHGHAVGDLVIRRLADVLREGVRTSDVAARLGGEEFCVLLRGADATVAERLAERLGQALRNRPVETEGGFVRVTASFGVASAQRGETWEALFSRADRALYQAKSAGRDRVKVAQEARATA